MGKTLCEGLGNERKKATNGNKSSHRWKPSSGWEEKFGNIYRSAKESNDQDKLGLTSEDSLLAAIWEGLQGHYGEKEENTLDILLREARGNAQDLVKSRL